jgi:hypothetical protein
MPPELRGVHLCLPDPFAPCTEGIVEKGIQADFRWDEKTALQGRSQGAWQELRHESAQVPVYLCLLNTLVPHGARNSREHKACKAVVLRKRVADVGPQAAKWVSVRTEKRVIEALQIRTCHLQEETLPSVLPSLTSRQAKVIRQREI